MNAGSLERRLAALELLAFDVDGVFTDGRFYLSDEGIETKAFNTQDGYGIRRVIEAGLAVAVISGRPSRATARRMAELGVEHVFLGCRDKNAAFDELLGRLGIGAGVCAYVGDDGPDAALLERAGVAIGVANAHPDILSLCDLVTDRPGGHGAVREVCDRVLAARAATGESA